MSCCLAQAHSHNFPDLPEPVANNAVVAVTAQNQTYLLSFMGLGRGKDYKDVHNHAYRLKVGDAQWQKAAPVPSSLTLKGRLASVAVTVKDKAYLFGGYTVAQDHSEISSPDNFAYNVLKDRYTKIAATPVPTDDAVALVYQERYIYLISGWHNDGNVNLVQVYDTQTDTWRQASPFLGKPVFGHAGGIVGDTMVVCDGVAVIPRPSARRTFAAETACYQGKVSQTDVTRIDWRTLSHPTGTARYRMAAAGHSGQQQILFYGGSDNPYNYNGVGYDGKPSEPDGHLWTFDLKTQTWQVKPTAKQTMDHRGLLVLGDKLLVLGGMGPKQTVLAAVTIVE